MFIYHGSEGMENSLRSSKEVSVDLCESGEGGGNGG